VHDWTDLPLAALELDVLEPLDVDVALPRATPAGVSSVQQALGGAVTYFGRSARGVSIMT
jgi:hypothetical protein